MTFLFNRNQFIDLYGQRVYTIAQNMEKAYQKLMKNNEHINFLKQCKQKGVIPKGMQVNNITNINRNAK
jgi:uncharacterized pyridoxamine 5'-phosphate oxidase family protein